ncbi:MAG TPA: DEAD/DEAH box helicase [Candidatus Acidoferrales bacterium]|nr:DEAD/DEAH box helicase [Candidatus Acidoferrales bacterium]
MTRESVIVEHEEILANCRATYRSLGFGTPYPFQEAAWVHILQGCNTLISAGTGSGKTEAAFLPALETGRRIVALYPTKALLQDQLVRIKSLAADKSIAVDTGDEDEKAFYRDDIILTSLDKCLYRLFGYGKRRWSYLYPYRIAFDNTRRTILILDEAHAYEDVAFSHFWFLLKKLTYERNVQTVLLSATLPPALVEAVEDEARVFFPRDANEGPFFKKVTDDEPRSGELMYAGHLSSSAVIDKALQVFDQGRRVIVVLDTVVPFRSDGHSLHEIWSRLIREVEARGPGTRRAEIARVSGADRLNGNILAYHGHQMPAYRKQVLDRLKELDETWKPDEDGTPTRGKPFILVTTSAMEVGVDISSDVMITDLCECDSFVQRIGRCARRPRETGEVYLIRDPGKQSQRGATVWELLKDRPEGTLIDGKIKQELNAHNPIPDLGRIHLRLEYLQDQSLYRYVYDFVQENRELWEKGIVITRDWEPSIAVVRSEQRNGATYIGGIPARDFWRSKEVKEKLLLPVSGAADISPYCVWVFEGYDEANQYTQRFAVGGSKERTLVEALRLAGISARSRNQDGNRVQPIYALGLPLVFVLGDPRGKTEPEPEGTVPYGDPNIGLRYRRQFAKPEQEPKAPPSPSPGLRVRKVLLRKGRYELPLYWFEPSGGRETGEESKV